MAKEQNRTFKLNQQAKYFGQRLFGSNVSVKIDIHTSDRFWTVYGRFQESHFPGKMFPGNTVTFRETSINLPGPLKLSFKMNRQTFE